MIRTRAQSQWDSKVYFDPIPPVVSQIETVRQFLTLGDHQRPREHSGIRTDLHVSDVVEQDTKSLSAGIVSRGIQRDFSRIPGPTSYVQSDVTDVADTATNRFNVTVGNLLNFIVR